MIDFKSFFKTFMVNYFDYKAAYLKSSLENYKDLHLEGSLFAYSDYDFQLSIRSDIRQTLFQAIETVFDILFALCPEKNGHTHEKDILRKLSTKEFHYDKIFRIANDPDGFDFLMDEVHLNNGKRVSAIIYAFFFGVYNVDGFGTQIDSSLDWIKKGLHLLAVEFSDRREYNSYKHGLRIIPIMKEFTISDPENKVKPYTIDLSQSMTYFQSVKNMKDEYITKVFDTERDLNLVELCSHFLWNMIKFRDFFYNTLVESKNGHEPLNIIFYGEDKILKAGKVNVPFQNIRLTWTFCENDVKQ